MKSNFVLRRLVPGACGALSATQPHAAAAARMHLSLDGSKRL